MRQIVTLIAAVAWLLAAAHARAQAIPITHVVIIMQENRSFDSYFGTFPGADGIPAGTCVPYNPSDPSLGCAKPYEDPLDVSGGGPHSAAAAQADLDDGITQAKMDGFVYEEGIAQAGSNARQAGPRTTANPPHSVMGYHTAAEIPNYWTYATHFVLQDAMFEGVRGWSAGSHEDLTSEWSAICANQAVALTCRSSAQPPTETKTTILPWASLFQLLDLHGVSWKYYLGTGLEPDCDDDEMDCAPEPQASTLPSIWNPAPYFAYVQSQGAAYLAQHNPPIDQFLVDLKNNQLPQVSWLVPSQQYSEHPRTGFTAGMDYVTSLVNAVMLSPYWQNTAIFISWDDWGGFYDHVVPPNIDRNNTINPIQGFGLRVPGLLISAYARQGYIDHHTLSIDSYATLFEDLFMDGARLEPKKLGNPDHRPTIRDKVRFVTRFNGKQERIGKLISEFDFTAPPQPPLILSSHIPSSIAVSCTAGVVGNIEQCGNGPVTISWDQITGPDVSAVYTFHVQRDGVDLPQCVTTQASCVDTPGPGQHLYRAYSVDPNGLVSPTSAAAQADVLRD
jgi:phospholipase C